MSVTKIKSSQLLEEIMHALFPPGTIMFYASYKGDIPGFMFCDGRNLLRADYPDLYNIIGTTYGTTNFDNFNIPDLRGEFIRGWDGGRGVDSGRGVGSWQVDEFKSHRHTLSLENNAGHGNSGHPIGGDGPPYYETNVGMLDAGGTETRPRNMALAAYIKY